MRKVGSQLRKGSDSLTCYFSKQQAPLHRMEPGVGTVMQRAGPGGQMTHLDTGRCCILGLIDASAPVGLSEWTEPVVRKVTSSWSDPRVRTTRSGGQPVSDFPGISFEF